MNKLGRTLAKPFEIILEFFMHFFGGTKQPSTAFYKHYESKYQITECETF